MHATVMAGYSKWAPTYDEALNPLISLESRIMRNLLTNLRDKRVLDAGCGTGRWIQYLTAQHARACGIDLCEPMLQQAIRKHNVSSRCAAGDLNRLPFASNTFDLALCSLTLSYTPDIRCAVAELSRVARTVIITDLHPEAMRRGWTRSFREKGTTWEIEHFPYSLHQLESAADSAGLRMAARIDAEFGEPEHQLYRLAGKAAVFEEVSSVPAVLITKWTK
jgi:ubiquinone/menaquinone biosynthesis C-methylase UbiE